MKMALFEDFTKKAAKFTEGAIDKTQEVAGNAKIKLKIKNLESDKDDIYRELGKYYFNLISSDSSINEDLKQKVRSINELDSQIEELRKKLEEK